MTFLQVWDWLEKRPTCPMCRTPVDLDESGIQVLSYFDIKHAIRVNRPTDAQSYISSVSGLNTEPKEETSAVDEGSNDGNGSNIEPPVSLKPIIEVAKAQNNPETANSVSSMVSSKEKGPPIPVTNSQELEESSGRAIDVVANVQNDHRVAPEMGEPAGHVATVDINPDSGRRLRRTSESRSRPVAGAGGTDRHRRATLPMAYGIESPRPSHQEKESRSRHMQQQHGGRTRRSSESRSHHHRQAAPHRRRGTQSAHEASHVTAPSDTPHARRKRQSRRRCEICGRRYEGDPRDIVVGYISSCGHFYHCLCLDGYIRKHETCPRCHYEAKEARKRGQTPPPERRVTFTEVFLAFLLDILHEADADAADSTLAHSNGVGTRVRHNRSYVVEMDRF